MKIVINIPKEKYQVIKTAMYARVGEETAKQLIKYIKNGKPLKQEPKTGHWIYKNYNWHCSECDETPKTMGYVGDADFMREHFKYCNHCGAKMVEPQKSEASDG